MTDYHPLLARAIAGLDRNTGDARRALYDRARTALLAQLRSADPPLTEPEITRERLALEEAVRKIEAEAARQMRAKPPAPPPPPPSRPAAAPQPPSRRPGPPPGEPAGAPQPPPNRGARPGAGAPPASEDDGMRGLRDVIAEAESLGEATAQGARTAREAYASIPSDTPDLDRTEPRVEAEGMRAPAGRPPPGAARAPGQRPPPDEPPAPESQWVAPEEAPAPEAAQDLGRRRRVPGPAPRRANDFEPDTPRNPARRGLIAALLTVFVIAALGSTAYWQRDRISALFGAVRGFAPQAQKDTAQTRPKSEDRIGQEGVPQQTRPGTPPPQVAQRVVLYEEDPNNPEGNRYVGSALWRTETVSPGPGLAPELAIRADVEVPERRLAMTMSLRRNTDQALPASHTVEILFNLPADFAFGGVANVPGLLMKESEQTRGAPLSGLAVKVTNGFFLIGLSSAEADSARNLQLLRERSWFDIPIVYNNGRRAILAVEKGNPGERAFTDAFAAWRR
jgi:hypothetical protein